MKKEQVPAVDSRFAAAFADACARDPRIAAAQARVDATTAVLEEAEAKLAVMEAATATAAKAVEEAEAEIQNWKEAVSSTGTTNRAYTFRHTLHAHNAA